MYSAYKLNKQGDNIQFLSYHFPSFEPVCSWPVYRFFKRQVTWSGILISFPQIVVIHTIKGFSVVSGSRSRCFSGALLLFLWSNRCWQFDLWFCCLFWIQLEHLEFSRFTYCWGPAWIILSITLLACEMSTNGWQFEHSLALPFFGILMKTDLF